jgi:hypothetical protein
MPVAVGFDSSLLVEKGCVSIGVCLFMLILMADNDNGKATYLCALCMVCVHKRAVAAAAAAAAVTLTQTQTQTPQAASASRKPQAGSKHRHLHLHWHEAGSIYYNYNL